MTSGQLAKLAAFCTEWRAEAERLEGELAQIHQQGSIVDATGVAIALSIRRAAVKEIEDIIGTNGDQHSLRGLRRGFVAGCEAVALENGRFDCIKHVRNYDAECSCCVRILFRGPDARFTEAGTSGK